MNRKKGIATVCMFLLVMLPFSSAQFMTSSGYDASTQYSLPARGAQAFSSFAQSPYAGLQSFESSFFKQDVTSPFVRWRESISSVVLGPALDVGERILVQVADYEPKVVRASLLEKQDVPVFLKLEGSTPECLAARVTGDVEGCLPQIRQVEITVNKSSSFVRSFTYIPPRIGGYSLNNLGGILVFLARVRNESALPADNTIPVDLTARIYLDSSQSLLGISEQDVFVPQEAEKAFLDKADKSENAIFARKGFVRASAIDVNSATFAVYNKDLLPISFFTPAQAPAGVQVATVRLERNGVSRPVRLGYSGNVFQDTFVLRLNDIITPTDRAWLTVTAGGKNFALRPAKGALIFPNAHWRVDDVQKEQQVETSVAALQGEFPQMSEQVLKDLEKVAQSSKIFKEKHIVKLRNVDGGDEKVLTRTIITKGDGLSALNIVPPSESEVTALEDFYCPNLVALDPTGELKHDYACQAVARLRKVLASHPSTEITNNAYELLADTYNGWLVDYPACDTTTVNKVDQLRDVRQCGNFQQDMKRLAYYYYQRAGRQEQLEKISGQWGGFGDDEFLQDDLVRVGLEKVEKKTEQEKGSVKLEVANTRTDDLKIGDNVPGLGGKRDGRSFDWKVSDISPNAVTLRQTFSDSSVGNSEFLSLGQERDVATFETTTIQGKPSVKKVKLVDVKVKSFAHVTIIPATGRSVVTSNFRVMIGLDERPFKLTPEQLQEKIEDTKALIAKLDGIIKKMDALVKTWKKACLVTFGALTAKNVFVGGGSRALARRAVSQFYQEKCVKEVNDKVSDRVENCLAKYTDEMQSDVNTQQGVIDIVNQKLKGETAQTLKTCGNIEDFQQLRDFGVSADDCKEYLRYTALQEKYAGDQKHLEFINQQYKGFNLLAKKEQYDQAWAIVNKNKKEYADRYGGEKEAAIMVYRSIEDARTRGSVSEEVITLPSVKFSPNLKEGRAEKVTFDKGELKSEQLDLVRVNKLQYLIFTGGLGGELAGIGTDTNLRTRRLRSLAQEDAVDEFNNPIYVRDQFLIQVPSTSNSLITQQDVGGYIGDAAAALNGLAIIGDPKNNVVYGRGKPGTSIFRFYTPTVAADQSGTLYATAYRSGGVRAQFSSSSRLPVCYPTGEKGEYIMVNNRGATNLVTDFDVWNVGVNGNIDCGRVDDARVYTNQDLNIRENRKLRETYESIINNAPTCKNEGDDVRGRLNVEVTCSFKDEALANSFAQPRCTDVMDPVDCKILFNACDPVMCPPSRCNLGGRYPVSDVIATGIVGSAVLCAPNVYQGIVMPVCLTGIDAGLKALKSLLEGYQGCLEVKLSKGENVGLCDYTRAVGTCELVWRELISIFDLRGGVIDWLSSKLGGEQQGGAEYLTFKQNVKNVGDSFNYFTSEYSTTALAYYKGKGTEFGSQVCQLYASGKLPVLGEVFDKLSEPENPPQFDAAFDETPYIEGAGESLPIAGTQFFSNVKAYSLYRLYYTVYAGTGYAASQGVFSAQAPIAGTPNRPIRYSVYLHDSTGALDDFFMVDPERQGVTERVLERGKSATETVQRVAPKGYDQVCVIISGKRECGFGKVSSAFAVNYLNDQVVKAQAFSNITSADECSGSPASTSTALGGLGLASNLAGSQAGAAVSGLGSSLVNTGLVRVCNPTSPTADASRWTKVGDCGKDREGKSLGTCWLDRNSVSVKDVELQKELQTSLQALGKGLDQEKVISAGDSKTILQMLNKLRDALLEALKLKKADTAKKEVAPVSLYSSSAQSESAALASRARSANLLAQSKELLDLDKWSLDFELNELNDKNTAIVFRFSQKDGWENVGPPTRLVKGWVPPLLIRLKRDGTDYSAGVGEIVKVLEANPNVWLMTGGKIFWSESKNIDLNVIREIGKGDLILQAPQ